MKQTDFLIRVEHTSAHTEKALKEILARSGVGGCTVTVLDTVHVPNSDDPRNYFPYIAH